MRSCLIGICVLLAGTPAFAAPWHLSGWQGRAVVEIPKPLAEAGVDTAAVKILCQGLVKPDAGDYRVLDAAGKPVPFQVTFHDPARYSLISFKAADPKQLYFVYFGNPQAARAKEEVSADPAPGAGPPKGEWVPHYGLVLETRLRPEKPKDPRTVAEMVKLLAECKEKEGARYQRRISDGYNPFGSSDYYVSCYRGWIRIPKAGTYQFCTVSSKASFSFLDGKELVSWPGRHTVDRGIHGEVNNAVKLAAGPHYIEYYQEAIPLEHMAFLGWRPSADQGQFGAIPEDVFTAPHEGVVRAYESPQGPLPRFEPVIVDSVWPADRYEGQYTRCRFRVENPQARTTYRWDFGDGQSAAGPGADHVYLALGKYPVTLTATGPRGTHKVTWPLQVFEIEHVTKEFKDGSPREYAALALKYDRGKLDAAALRELAYLLAENEQPAEAITVGQEFLKRFGGSQPALAKARMRRLLADCALREEKADLKGAIADYQAALVPEMPAAEKLDVLARLIHVLGIERGLPAEADKIMAQVEKTWAAGTNTAATRKAYRRALIAMGDVLLWHKKLADAVDFYKRAEALGAFLPSQVRKARLGAYPNALRDFIEAGNYGAALDLVNRWDETFPTDKVNGQTFFWRGKLLELRGQPRAAARYLARAVGLAPGSAYESEARWLLAEALEKLGKPQEAKRELARLVASGVKDRFSAMAREKLGKQ